MAWAMPTFAPVGLTVIGKPARIGRIPSGRFALRAHVDAWKGKQDNVESGTGSSLRRLVLQ